MKPLIIFAGCVLLAAAALPAKAQCSICTRTAQQLGERPAKALNKGIIMLAFTPLAIGSIIGYRWWKNEKQLEENTND